MTFIQAIKSIFRNYANFKGRAVRSEYWYLYLFYILLGLLIVVIDNILGTDIQNNTIALSLIGLPLFLPSLAVEVRRLHDVNRSGWWVLISFVPYIGSLVLLYWNIQKGTIGPNRFGVDPLGMTNAIIDPI